MVKLKIGKLAQIENSEIEVKPFTIFFGESNTNKSYTLFALYYMYKLIKENNIANDFLQNKALSPIRFTNEEEIIQSFTVFDEKIERHMKELLIKNIRANDVKRISLNTKEILEFIDSKFQQKINTFFQDLFLLENPPSYKISIALDSHELYEIFFSEGGDGGEWFVKEKNTKKFFAFGLMGNFRGDTIEKIKEKLLINGLKSIIDRLFPQKELFLLPPARGSIVDLQDSLLLMSFEDFSFPGVIKEFLKTYIPILKTTRIYQYEMNKFFEELFFEIFEMKPLYDRRTRKTTLKLKNCEEIPITAVASSIKEISPLYFILRAGNLKRKAIFIEEPEAHLHPSLQIKMAYLLSSVVKHGGNIFLTTHSDYFIGALNNLIKLWNIKELNPELANSLMEKYSIREEYLVSPEDIAVYLFKKCENHKVKVERINIGRYGIPLASFRDAFRKLADMTEELHYELFNLEKLNIKSSGKRSKN